MQMPHWHFNVPDLFWATLSLLGMLAMVGCEAIAMRLLVGKW